MAGRNETTFINEVLLPQQRGSVEANGRGRGQGEGTFSVWLSALDLRHLCTSTALLYWRAGVSVLCGWPRCNGKHLYTSHFQVMDLWWLTWASLHFSLPTVSVCWSDGCYLLKGFLWATHHWLFHRCASSWRFFSLCRCWCQPGVHLSTIHKCMQKRDEFGQVWGVLSEISSILLECLVSCLFLFSFLLQKEKQI